LGCSSGSKYCSSCQCSSSCRCSNSQVPSWLLCYNNSLPRGCRETTGHNHVTITEIFSMTTPYDAFKETTLASWEIHAHLCNDWSIDRFDQSIDRAVPW
jgi:hypothetical protein